MQRIALCLEYNGATFNGWQAQTGLPSVEEALTQAIARIADHPIKVVTAGRTDKGVHAEAQVVHFDTHANRSNNAWIGGVNRYLPESISVKWVARVPNSFHARFSATARSYRYVLLNQPLRFALGCDLMTWHYKPLDAQRMHQASQYLLGQHDFSAFRDSECQAKSPVRTLSDIAVKRDNNKVILTVKANAFLHHMVRNIVGTLLPVGEGVRDVSWVKKVLETRDRREAGVTAVANGLYLVGVDYPGEFELPGCSI